MKYRLIWGIMVSLIFSSLVFASDNAPPAIPMEIWGEATINGNPATNGLSIVAEVDSVDYTQGSPVTFNDGYYDIMLVGGDRELTYIDDPTCATHWGDDEACVPCSTEPSDEDYCIEGPQDGAIVNIKINSIGAMPYVDWANGSSEELEMVTPMGDWDEAGCVDMTDFGYFANHYGENPISAGWNMIYDLFKDGTIDMADFGYFANHYGEGCS